ncbi:hypothetical protein LLE49_12260 [Alicyclobacillus tolerans]|uniref:hypothetical protein n=1 Tax=Alicyclobacillus tolerans TaxID=90970 RepID=UPI001F2BC66A|nr:hypothetical protein [Alicyclobacillus tolerans]MCF8565490.1 hypothetical protein [Alicyclobacillus tolerans]
MILDLKIASDEDMKPETKPCPTINDAIRKVHAIVSQAKELGYDILGADVGPHLNPGDVYDAYEAIE